MSSSLWECPFEWLYDGHPEDGIQEYAHLRVDLAATPKAAAEKMTELYNRDQGALTDYGAGARFVGTGTAWLRGNIEVYVDDEDEPTETLWGTLAERHATLQDRLDELFYATCKPSDEGAREFWRCDLVFTEAVDAA